MKFIVPALSAFALIAPAFAADLQERHHQSSGSVVTVHDKVVETKFATKFVTVTLGADQAQCTQSAESVHTTAASSNNNNSNQYQYHQQGNGSHNQHTEQAQAASRTTEAPVIETVTSTRTVTSTVMHPTTVAVTSMSEGHTVVRTVTKTVTDLVRSTEVVTKTRTKTIRETDHVTETDVVQETQASDSTTTANVAENTTTSDGGSIADVNTNVVTVTDVETSTFLFTTTIGGNAATETGTTTITSDASTSTDVGGNIADVTTSDSASSTSTADGSTSTDDPQTSLTLDPRVIESAFASDGQATPNPGQVASLTSTNNFVNFCLTQNVPLTNGQQIRTGSCNVVPQGFIIAKDKLPSAKFVFPVNFSKIPANQAFTAKLKINNLQAGAFTNANTNYYAAPAQVNAQGILIGHSHLVIEKLNSLNDTEPADPTKFSFFKGLNLPLDGDSTVSADLTAGLPAGDYRMFSINTAANHQPALASIAQHGSMDDGVYFTCE